MAVQARPLALAVTIAFLGINGRRLTLSNDEAYELVVAVACCTELRTKGLADRGITVFRGCVGEYRPSLGMAGALLSLLQAEDALKNLLLAPAQVAYRVV
jgi:hypothetical protein